MPFPDPRTYDFAEWVRIGDYYYPSGDVLSYGEPLTPENVVEAYRMGVFPWNTEGIPLPWYCPERRAILEFSELTIPRSLAKVRRSTELTFTIDKEFRGVIESCARAKRSRESGKTWIDTDFIRVYCELHAVDVTHSVEAWDPDGNLVGGLYGVDAGVFCGESMFYLEPNASKLALLFLIDHLRERGSTWLDIQVMTPHLEALGAKEISRGEFLEMLKETQLFERKLF